MRKIIDAGIIKFAILWAAFASFSTGVNAAERGFIEVHVDAKNWQVQVIAHNAQDFWFLGHDGKDTSVSCAECQEIPFVGPHNSWAVSERFAKPVACGVWQRV